MRDGFYASEVHNPDSYGFNFADYDWKGVKVEGGRGKLVSYKGARALEAFLGARKNPIFELAVTTGAIADFTTTAIGQNSSKAPQDLASQRDNFKKKRRSRGGSKKD